MQFYITLRFGGVQEAAKPRYLKIFSEIFSSIFHVAARGSSSKNAIGNAAIRMTKTSFVIDFGYFGIKKAAERSVKNQKLSEGR